MPFNQTEPDRTGRIKQFPSTAITDATALRPLKRQINQNSTEYLIFYPII